MEVGKGVGGGGRRGGEEEGEGGRVADTNMPNAL